MGSDRNLAIDFLRGVLVVFMLLGHCFQFFNPTFWYVKYDMWVPGAFIFMAGFMMSFHYSKSYNLYTANIYYRIIQRSIKLLLIFLVANIIIQNLLTNEGGFAFFHNNDIISLDFYYNVFVKGDPGISNFHIILPIAYTLIFSCALIFIFKSNLVLSSFPVILFIIICAWLWFFNNGGYNARFLSVGLLGFFFGLGFPNNFERIYKQKYYLFLIFFLYQIFISFVPSYYLVYLINVILVLVIIYIISLSLNFRSKFEQAVILLGQYSLLSYLAQIAMLWATSLLFENDVLNSFLVLLIFLILSICLFLLIKIIHDMRQKSLFINGIYRLMFA